MFNLTLVEKSQLNYPIVYLVPYLRKEDMVREYIDRFEIPHEDVLFLTLHYEEGKKKTSVEEMKRYINEELMPALKDVNAQYIVVADGDYFKVLTKNTKVDANAGYVLDCAFGPYKVISIPNYRQIFYDPDKIRHKIKQGTEALLSHIGGSYKEPGTTIIHTEHYPRTNSEIAVWLERLLAMDCDLTIDIEAFSLKHFSAGIGTITFCWNKHEGVAFPVDYEEIPGATEAPFGKQTYNKEVRAMLCDFFKRFKRRAIYHSIGYDVTVLIYQLFMKNLIDTEGVLDGLDIMMNQWEDTKLITYLATNSCAGNKLGLKEQAQEFSGNYAQEEINDITRIRLPDLLRYNLVDGLSTWFVYEKHWATMIADEQFEIYTTLFKPAMIDIVQMQLTGMPLNMKRVKEVKIILEDIEKKALDTIQNTNVVKQFTYRLNEDWVEWKNSTLKKKRVTLADAKEVFNPNSGPQLQKLLFEMLGLPVISLTDSKQPSTDGDSLRALVHHTKDEDILSFLNAMLEYGAVNKILTSFIPAFERAAQGPDGWYYLFGNFNLGGTLSGRLSSSDPNLQNLPSTNTKMAINKLIVKLIKSCFEAPPGWLFSGLDFASLEDKISAVTTKDPNKLKVYTDGYDGHSLRAYAYFTDEMTDIRLSGDKQAFKVTVGDKTEYFLEGDHNIPTTAVAITGKEFDVASINSIQYRYKPQRQDSKAPTFALTYQGTFITLMTNCGFSKEKAQAIEAKYHELYKVSDDWVQNKLDLASKTGYVVVAFGLRVRTPLLKQVITGLKKTPYEAKAEGRTAGNALGQSWCLLNSRASAEFMSKVRKSVQRLNIRPCAHIHDAQYLLVRDDIDTVLYVNEHLVKAVQWQEHPDIAHDEVKLGGEFSIFWPNWTGEITIPNYATADQIYSVIEKSLSPKK